MGPPLPASVFHSHPRIVKTHISTTSRLEKPTKSPKGDRVDQGRGSVERKIKELYRGVRDPCQRIQQMSGFSDC